MKSSRFYKSELSNNGFAILESIYTQSQTEAIVAAIENADQSKATFRKSADLFAFDS
ncbi:MAG: hypothetical protein ACTHMM_16065 [Agriterribacter sp.]